jgi:hypothetical protein
MYESVDDGGAEVWFRIANGGPRSEWGGDTEFHNSAFSCTYVSDDEITLSEERVADGDEPIIPSEAADEWNEEHARAWAEENVGDLVNVDDIPGLKARMCVPDRALARTTTGHNPLCLAPRA